MNAQHETMLLCCNSSAFFVTLDNLWRKRCSVAFLIKSKIYTAYIYIPVRRKGNNSFETSIFVFEHSSSLMYMIELYGWCSSHYHVYWSQLSNPIISKLFLTTFNLAKWSILRANWLTIVSVSTAIHKQSCTASYTLILSFLCHTNCCERVSCGCSQ